MLIVVPDNATALASDFAVEQVHDQGCPRLAERDIGAFLITFGSAHRA